MSTARRPLSRGARFSRCKRYRYALTREWGDGGTVMFVGLNPSTADNKVDDPTVRRCIGFARGWGYGKLVLVNLFGYRTTDPSKLAKVADPIGPGNDRWISEFLESVDLIVAAWGRNGRLRDRHVELLRLLPRPYCLGITKSGLPKHPLYLPRDLKPIPFPNEW